MAQWSSIEEVAAKYGYETEYVWVLISMREITVDYERPGVDIIDDESVQDFVNRNKNGLTLMYVDKLERYCIDHSKLCSMYLSLLGKQDKDIIVYKSAKYLYDELQDKWKKQCGQVQKLEKELALVRTTCRTCWLKKLCMIFKRVKSD